MKKMLLAALALFVFGTGADECSPTYREDMIEECKDMGGTPVLKGSDHNYDSCWLDSDR